MTHHDGDPLPNRFSTIQSVIFRRKATSSERETISHGLVDAENDLHTYQAEINKLKAAMMVLEMRRDGLTKSMAKYRSLLSPIHRLPEEVLAHIFSFCCEDNFLAPGCPPSSALILSAVCGCWRDVVLETPYLWSSIYIYLGSNLAVDSEGIWDSREFCHLIEIFMERSKMAPLNLEFSEFDNSASEYLEAGLNCLINQSNRWRSLIIRGHDHPLITMPPVFQHLQGRLPNVQNLLLEYEWWNSEVSIASDLDLFSGSLSLTSIDLDVRVLQFNPGFPWAQIQYLSLAGCIPSHVVQTLAFCKNLKQLKLSESSDGDNQSLAAGPITTIDKLQCLSVEGSQDDGLFLFQFFTLPSLSSLRVYGHSSATRWDLPSLEDFLLRSSCSITSLTLGFLPLSDTETLHLLRLIPTLSNFSLEERIKGPFGSSFGSSDAPEPENKVVTVTFLEQFVEDDDESEQSTHFLPQLENLTLTIYRLKPTGREVLQRVLASRCTGLLREFTLTVRNVETYSEALDYESLQSFKDTRVHLRLQMK